MAQSFIERIRGAVSFFGLGIAPLPTTRDNAIPTITSGAGAPGTTPADGSLYLRTNGAAATTLYARAAGAWGALTAVGNDYGAGGILTDVIGESTGGADLTITAGTSLLVDQISDVGGAGVTIGVGGTVFDALNVTFASGAVVSYAAEILWTHAAGSITVSNAAAEVVLWHDDVFVVVDPVAPTKRARLDVVGVTAGQTRVINVPDRDVELALVPIEITDPGNAGAIPVTQSGVCNLASGGVETRTLAIPTYNGQTLVLMCATYVGNITITSAQRLNQAGNVTMTFGAVEDAVFLVAVEIGAALRWKIFGNDGVALS